MKNVKKNFTFPSLLENMAVVGVAEGSNFSFAAFEEATPLGQLFRGMGRLFHRTVTSIIFCVVSLFITKACVYVTQVTTCNQSQSTRFCMRLFLLQSSP